MAAMSTPSADPLEASEFPECLGENLHWLLTQAQYALATELGRAFEPLGLSPRGHSVLSAALTGAHTQKALADIVGLDKTTMVATLDELERAGFARRVPSPTDRRAHVIEVTPEGKRKVSAAARVTKKVQADVLAGLDGDGCEFLGMLGRLVRERLSEPVVCKGVRRREPR